MKAKLYWQLSNKHWFFTFDDRPTGGPDGVEYHGDYEITMKGATLSENIYGDKMVEYKGELYDLQTSQDKVRPYIYYSDPHDYSHDKAIPLFFKADKIN